MEVNCQLSWRWQTTKGLHNKTMNNIWRRMIKISPVIKAISLEKLLQQHPTFAIILERWKHIHQVSTLLTVLSEGKKKIQKISTLTSLFTATSCCSKNRLNEINILMRLYLLLLQNYLTKHTGLQGSVRSPSVETPISPEGQGCYFLISNVFKQTFILEYNKITGLSSELAEHAQNS